jgi:putative acetyltransferase
VAEDNDIIIGYIAISPVTISDGSKGWFGLGPISVLPDRQRQGVGSELTKRALSRLKNMGASGGVVLGEPNYYRRFGFTVEPSLVLPGVPPEYFQALCYSSEIPRGEVAYHEAFNAQG